MDQSSATRPRGHSRTWSHRSDKSAGSKSSKPKDVFAESPADKKRRDSFWKGGSKANPNAAINEVQPGDAAVLEKATIESLRNVQHKDADGNIITEPDLSNPTRPRFERPLDTIRSFERNIEAGYSRRSSSRNESYDPREQYASRRSSYYGGHDGRHQPPPMPSPQNHAGYYGAQRRQRDGLADDGTSPMAPPSRNRFNQRVNGGPMSRAPSSTGFYGTQGYNSHESYDAGMHSDSTGPWNNSTDPSSENSSLDRAVKPLTPQPVDGYGYPDAAYNGAPIMEEYDSGSDGYGMSHRSATNGAVPPVPGHSQAPPVRAPIKLGGAGGGTVNQTQGGSLPSMARKEPAKDEKKGFFKKRFSKS